MAGNVTTRSFFNFMRKSLPGVTPVPSHYVTSEYWDWVYLKTSASDDTKEKLAGEKITPADIMKTNHNEWQMGFSHLQNYKYCRPNQSWNLANLTSNVIEGTWDDACGGAESKEGSTLIMGCGDSILGEEMYDAGWKRICCIDFSPVCIDVAKMRNETFHREGIDWKVMDATKMDIEDESYDCTIDKGLIDAMHLAHRHDHVNQVIEESFRVLKPEGRAIWLTLNKPEVVLPVLEQLSWKDIQVRRLEKTFLYICTKHFDERAFQKPADKEIKIRQKRKNKKYR